MFTRLIKWINEVAHDIPQLSEEIPNIPVDHSHKEAKLNGYKDSLLEDCEVTFDEVGN